MLDAYADAFSRYLRTGTVGALSGFCAAGADLGRLRVYRNGFLKACIDALRANYPAVERLVDEARFPALARPFVEAHPPRVASLVEYGAGFPQHVRTTREMHGLDWLASFAALDRAWTEVCFAPDEVQTTPPARTSGKVETLSDPGDAGALMNLRGRLSPWVRLVSLEHRVLDAWRRLRESEPGTETEFRPAPQPVLVWRSGGEVLYRSLTAPEHAFIAGVAAGDPCGEAAGAALALDADFDLVATFASLLHHRALRFEP